jgi:uncharacterized protein (DUF3820 family)
MRITFEKYTGALLEDLPEDYLIWGVENMEGSRKQMFENELKRRNQTTAMNLKKETLKQIRDSLAKQYHPDKGGNSEAMKAINEFYNQAVKLL